MARNRLTWAQDQKTASAPPAIPGYDEYFREDPHPAAQPDPEATDYEKGDTSAWAEDPTKGPYPQSGEPALPGYGTENKDHPAAKKAALEAAALKKAAKCVRIAQKMLGPDQKTAAYEDQALSLMAMPDEELNASLARMGESIEEDEPGDDAETASIKAELEAVKAELEALKGGKKEGMDDLLFNGAAEEPVKAEIVDDDPLGIGLYDTDDDGFIEEEDWGGSPAVFAALDSDRDGIVAVKEACLALGTPKAAKRDKILGMDRKALAALGLGPKEMTMLAAMEDEENAAKKAGEVPEAFKENWDKGDKDEKKDDGDKKDEKDDKKPDFLKEKEEGKKAADRLAELRAKRGAKVEAKKAEEDEDAVEPQKTPEEKTEAKKAAEDEKPEEKKEACDAAFDTTDPMGLDDGVPPDSDDAILDEIFGGKKAAEDEKPEEKEAALRPQDRRAGATITTIGQMARTASGRSDVDDLSKLWTTAEDVSSAFGMGQK